MDDPRQPDMFGQSPTQGALFDEPTVATPKANHTPETIRARMLDLIAKARAADSMPWTPREAHSHNVMFPYMAEWLPKEEGEQLLLEFRTELERLQKAA